MGGGSSKSALNIDTQTLNQTTKNFITTNSQTTNLSAALFQAAEFNNLQALSCMLNISQTGNVAMKAISNFDTNNTVDLKETLNTEIDSQVDKQADQSSGWGSIPSDKQSSDMVTVKTNIKNILDEKITSENLNQMIQNVSTMQSIKTNQIKFDPCGYSLYPNGPPEFAVNACQPIPECNVGQDMVIDLFSEQISSSIAKAISENEAISQVVQDIAMVTDQSGQGLGDSIGDIGRGAGEGIGSAAGGVGGGISTAAEGVGAGVGGVLEGATMPFIISGVVLIIAIIGFVLLKPKSIGKNGATFGN